MNKEDKNSEAKTINKIKPAKRRNGRKMINTTVSFKFPMTSDEAYEVLKNKNGKIAKKFRKYLNDVLIATANKCLEELKKAKDREAVEDVMTT